LTGIGAACAALAITACSDDDTVAPKTGTKDASTSESSTTDSSHPSQDVVQPQDTGPLPDVRPKDGGTDAHDGSEGGPTDAGTDASTPDAEVDTGTDSAVDDAATD